jgi:hypothetical protein
VGGYLPSVVACLRCAELRTGSYGDRGTRGQDDAGPGRSGLGDPHQSGQVLVCIDHDPDIRLRDIGDRIGLTERAVPGSSPSLSTPASSFASALAGATATRSTRISRSRIRSSTSERSASYSRSSAVETQLNRSGQSRSGRDSKLRWSRPGRGRAVLQAGSGSLGPASCRSRAATGLGIRETAGRPVEVAEVDGGAHGQRGHARSRRRRESPHLPPARGRRALGVRLVVGALCRSARPTAHVVDVRRGLVSAASGTADSYAVLPGSARGCRGQPADSRGPSSFRMVGR